MRPNPRYPQDIKAWFGKAKDDFRWGKYDLKGGFYSQACLAAQQTIEKVLKAFLLSNNILVRKTHNLNILLRKCIKFDKSLARFRDECRIIDRYYFESRYPDFGPTGEYGREQAQEALKTAREILDNIEGKIKKQL